MADWAAPNRIECCYTAENRVLYVQVNILFEQHHTSTALALQNIGAIAAAENGRVAVWADSPLYSGLGTAFTAARWRISAGTPPRQLTRLVLRLYA